MLFDVACDRVLERFKLKKPEILPKKSVSLETLADGMLLKFNQPYLLIIIFQSASVVVDS